MYCWEKEENEVEKEKGRKTVTLKIGKEEGGKKKKESWAEEVSREVKKKIRNLRRTICKNFAPDLLSLKSCNPSSSCPRVSNPMITFLLYTMQQTIETS